MKIKNKKQMWNLDLYKIKQIAVAKHLIDISLGCYRKVQKFFWMMKGEEDH